jgi:lipoprotein-releasing system permease protein
VFLAASARLVAVGMVIGNVSAFVICMIQKTTHVLKLNPENYYVSFIPVNVDVLQVLAADVLSFVVIMLLLLIPCLFISKVDPSQTVRVR